MLGAIIGDIVGSKYEFSNIKTKDFPLFSDDCFFTDDTVMTIAVNNALKIYELNRDLDEFKETLIDEMQRLGNKFPDVGYGHGFAKWLASDNPMPYGSYGNGSAMRVSPVGFFAKTLDEALLLSKASALVTHNHTEGIKGAQATAAAIFLARKNWGKDRIKNYITGEFYEINFTLDQIRDSYSFDSTCQGSVPQALQCFFEGEDFEDVIRNCISIGGDCDTIAAIAGGIAQGYYEIPEEIIEDTMKYLSKIEEEIR